MRAADTRSHSGHDQALPNLRPQQAPTMQVVTRKTATDSAYRYGQDPVLATTPVHQQQSRHYLRQRQ